MVFTYFVNLRKKYLGQGIKRGSHVSGVVLLILLRNEVYRRYNSSCGFVPPTGSKQSIIFPSFSHQVFCEFR